MNDESKAKVDTGALLAKLKSNASDPVDPVDPVPEVVAPISTTEVLLAGIAGATPPVPPDSEAQDLYQVYNSSRTSTCLITPTGKRINFTNYLYYTKDSEIIDYLDAEIAQGFIPITKGKKLTAKELDPETAKKREIIEEFKASQEGRKFGNTKAVEDRTSALNSDQVAN